jgi:hypothetical protein
MEDEMLDPPGDVTTLTGAIEQLGRQGFTASFEPASGGLIARESGRMYRADQLAIRQFYRFEGVSDPDEQSVAYALEAADGTRGILVDGFGLYANPRVAEALRDVVLRPSPPCDENGPIREATWPPPSPAHECEDAA